MAPVWRSLLAKLTHQRRNRMPRRLGPASQGLEIRLELPSGGGYDFARPMGYQPKPLLASRKSGFKPEHRLDRRMVGKQLSCIGVGQQRSQQSRI